MDIFTARSWLVFQQIPGLTYGQKHELLTVFGKPQALFEQEDLSFLPQPSRLVVQALQQQGSSHECYQRADAILEQAEKEGVHILCLNSEAYPHLLSEIHRPPFILYAKGQVNLLESAQLGVVGARKATALAKKITREWCAMLAQAGITITSGLALGIDSHAHQGALQASGKTIAVMANGLDQIYPARNSAMADEILEQGLLLSEFTFGTPPMREYFPQRNRLISGLSLAVWVVEAAMRSGSLITARYAMEQGRDVLATPSAVNNGMAKGCHHLIKQGAQLVDGCEDILQALALPLSFSCQTASEAKAKEALSTQAEFVLSLMNAAPVHINELAKASSLSVDQLAVELTLLELEGKIANQAGYYQKIV